MHEFEKSYEIGKEAEDRLDIIFGKWFNIKKVDKATDKRGIDRVFECKHFPEELTVQYKADTEAHNTGNLFIEVVSVDKENTPGWAVRPVCNWLVIAVEPEKKAYVISPAMLRVCVPMLAMQFPIRNSVNKGYWSKGVCVPVEQIIKRQFCIGVFGWEQNATNQPPTRYWFN